MSEDSNVVDIVEVKSQSKDELIHELRRELHTKEMENGQLKHMIEACKVREKKLEDSLYREETRFNELFTMVLDRATKR